MTAPIATLRHLRVTEAIVLRLALPYCSICSLRRYLMRKILLWLFSHRFLAIGRWDTHFLLLRLRNTLTRQRTRIAAFMASRLSPRYLNLGSGPRGLDDAHWVNVDGFADKNVHFLIDISRALPFPD